jgi:hypothetical protein
LDRPWALYGVPQLGKLMLPFSFVLTAEDAHESEAKGGDLVAGHVSRVPFFSIVSR